MFAVLFFGMVVTMFELSELKKGTARIEEQKVYCYNGEAVKPNNYGLAKTGDKCK